MRQQGQMPTSHMFVGRRTRAAHVHGLSRQEEAMPATAAGMSPGAEETAQAAAAGAVVRRVGRAPPPPSRFLLPRAGPPPLLVPFRMELPCPAPANGCSTGRRSFVMLPPRPPGVFDSLVCLCLRLRLRLRLCRCLCRWFLSLSLSLTLSRTHSSPHVRSISARGHTPRKSFRLEKMMGNSNTNANIPLNAIIQL
jgi:hypothetical protein